MAGEIVPKTYDFISRFNHWIVAFVMIAMLAFGVYLENAELARPEKGYLIGIHKAVGVLVLVYGLWRVGYRLAQGFPAPVGPAPHWQELVAKAVHWILLTGILLMPVSGLMMSLFGGRPVSVFGLVTLPAFGEIDLLHDIGGAMHSIGGKLMIVAVILHIAGTMKHRLIDRDATLARMVTGRG